MTPRTAGAPVPEGRCVVYWMQRAQRGIDNPALDVAIQVANELQKPLAVFFGLHPKYPNANWRHYAFLVDGLAETAERIEQRGAAFVYRPYPQHNLLQFCAEVQPCLVIGDENPLRAAEHWRQRAAAQLRVPFYTVDADVIVPTKYFPREEYSARTMRPKMRALLSRFLIPDENPQAQFQWDAKSKPKSTQHPADSVLEALPLDRGTSPVLACKGGTAAGLHQLQTFVRDRLARYDTDRNQPHLDGTSRLSAYLHFGHLSPLTIALAVEESTAPTTAKAAFLEELIVRRELAVNFVARNAAYDHLDGCPEWARKTLAKSASDPRDVLYTEAQLENAATHDGLWNAAQMEMVKSGRMHGYLRMYWAKKILEWTPTPAEAFAIAVRLNDRYFLDGRDPNGYTGVAWAIGGKHDRPWGPRRPIFGTVRYMSYEGCKRKFDVAAYIQKVSAL
ncbi:MAG TPA: deoxyribodipyrimidine photo-lyase [Blastocatellia bacterium]|nr:deoxyribodipyrimidine photo-lyase [Blastocatellia bacterium]